MNQEPLSNISAIQLKTDFPIFLQKSYGQPIIYLDSAATTQKPRCVIDAMKQFYETQYGTVHRAVYSLAARSTALYEAVREQVKLFVRANETYETIFTRGTTEGINLVAHSFSKAFLHAGDEILITETEHHSNIVPWQVACETYNAKLNVCPVHEDGTLNIEEFKKLLTHKTKLVAIAHTTNTTGITYPIETLIKMAHSNGTRVLIDGAQSAPHCALNLTELNPDFFVFSSHKMYGPTGLGILFGKKELLDHMPPYECGGDMIREVAFEKTTYNSLPLKFEAGTPSIAEVIGFGAALNYLTEIGIDRIHAWESHLLYYATDHMQSIPHLKILGTAKEKGPIISFVVEGVHPLDIGTLLDLKGICMRTGHLCAQPTMRRFGISTACRISFGLYNTEEDINRFLLALKEVIHLLRA